MLAERLSDAADGVLFKLIRRNRREPRLRGKRAGGQSHSRDRVFATRPRVEVVSAARTPAFAHAEGTTYPLPEFAAAYVVVMFRRFPPKFF